MQISVVNLSRRIADEQALEVVRAVNRQINEDFAPYWNTSATLRLEGSTRRLEDRGTPLLLRGDAILYLDDDPRDTGIDGYHSVNARGLPYGVVYTQVAEKLDGTWSITFSHEALELLGDPTMNTLAAGPHPVERDRHVFHWLEVCDPVQADTYRIDGVVVSNFVLPAYFDPSPHVAERHDFLGLRGVGAFAIAPGGYVTYWDPRSARNESVDADQEATRRRKLKAAHALMRGARRHHQWDHPHGAKHSKNGNGKKMREPRHSERGEAARRTSREVD